MIVKSAERVLRLLEFFAIIRRPATVSEVAKTLGLPQSSTSVLLRSLVELGYLEYLPLQRCFHPTMRVAVLGDWLQSGLFAGALTERLHELQRRTGETVMIGRRHGAEVQYIRIFRSDHPVQLFVQEGSRSPLATSAAGRALLSLLSDDKVRRIIRRNNAEAKRKEICVQESTVMESLRKIRRTGISETHAALGGEREYHAIATLIPRQGGLEQISLGIGGPKERILKHRDDLIQALLKWVVG